MSVIRRPGVLGETTYQRVLGVTAASSSTAVEVLAVGVWFLLLVEGGSVPAALLGLGALLVGAVLRARVFAAATGGTARPIRPRRFASGIALAGCWVGWLLVAERVGGVAGVAAAAAVLCGAIAGQFHFERRLFRVDCSDSRSPVSTAVVPAALVAVGATALLGATWLVDWSVATATVLIPVTEATVPVEIGAATVAFLAFCCCLFLAHRRRFRLTIT